MRHPLFIVYQNDYNGLDDCHYWASRLDAYTLYFDVLNVTEKVVDDENEDGIAIVKDVKFGEEGKWIVDLVYFVRALDMDRKRNTKAANIEPKVKSLIIKLL